MIRREKLSTIRTLVLRIHLEDFVVTRTLIRYKIIVTDFYVPKCYIVSYKNRI